MLVVVKLAIVNSAEIISIVANRTRTIRIAVASINASLAVVNPMVAKSAGTHLLRQNRGVVHRVANLPAVNLCGRIGCNPGSTSIPL